MQSVFQSGLSLEVSAEISGAGVRCGDAARVERWRKQLLDANMATVENVEGLNACILLLAALELNTHWPANLARATGLNFRFVSECVQRLQANRVWLGGGKWAIEEGVDLEKHGDVVFAIWSLVATGEVVSESRLVI